MLRSLIHSLLIGSSTLACSLLSSTTVDAQHATISDLGASFYSGFKSVDGQSYYLLRQEQNVYDLFHLEIYGQDLQKKGTTDLRLGRNWYQGGARAIGDYTVFYFFTGKEGMLVKIDALGQKVKEVHFPANEVFGSVTAIEPAGNGDFYLTYPIDTNKKGYVVARYGADLTAKWQKEYAPEKGKYRARFFQANATHVYAVADFSKGTWETVCLDGVTGTEKSHQELPVANTLTPSFASLDPAGNLIVAGTYTDPQKTTLVSAEKAGTPPRGGLFMLGIGPEGRQTYLTQLRYAEELAGKLNTRSTLQQFTVGDIPSVKLHSLLPKPGGGFVLIGETYKVFRFTDSQYDAAGGVRVPVPGSGLGGPGPERRNILDFVVFQLSDQGKLESFRRIPKPYKAYSNHNAGGGPQEFESKTSFTYRFLSPAAVGQLPNVVFLNWHQGWLYVNSLKPATDERDNLFTRHYLDQPAVPGVPDQGELIVRDYYRNTSVEPVELFYDEILPHVPGKFLYTHYDPAKSSLHLQVLEVPNR